MRFSNLLLSLLFVSILLFSCSQEDNFVIQNDIIETGHSENVQGILTLNQKLINIQNAGRSVITRSLYISKSQLQLKGYENIGVISSDKELEQLKSELLSDKGYFPYYDIDKESITLLTWAELKSDEKKSQIQYSKADLEEFLNKTIKVGMKKMELIWECNSKVYKTICITLDEDIIYDNIIMNILCVSKDSQLARGMLSKIKTRSLEGSLSGGSYTNTMEWTAYWLWGAERGYARVVHSISGNTGNLVSSSCYADSYMSIGSSSAKAEIKECRRGEGGYSVCNYAYYLATPLVSGSISGGGATSFSVSISGVGSQASGSGNDDLNSSKL